MQPGADTQPSSNATEVSSFAKRKNTTQYRRPEFQLSWIKMAPIYRFTSMIKTCTHLNIVCNKSTVPNNADCKIIIAADRFSIHEVQLKDISVDKTTDITNL